MIFSLISTYLKQNYNINITRKLLLLIVTCLFTKQVYSVGLLPVPDLKNVTTTTATIFDQVNNWYEYEYTISNPATSIGDIWYVKIDISQIRKNTAMLDSSGLTIPYGKTNPTFNEMLTNIQPLFLPKGTTLIPIGQEVPIGWVGGFGRDGYAGFSAQSGTPKITPGTSLGGFKILSRGLPTIRPVQIIPDWMLVIDDPNQITGGELDRTAEIEKNMVFNSYILGPADAFFLGSFRHWDLLRDDINKAETLGWFSDINLLISARSELAFAREAIDLNDGTLAKQRLQVLLNTIEASTANQRTQEIFDLMRFNTQSLINNTPDTPIPFEPELTLTPGFETRSVGTEHGVTATLVNVADNREPIVGAVIPIFVREGPHRGLGANIVTGQDGKAIFKFVGKKVGTDIIAIRSLDLIVQINQQNTSQILGEPTPVPIPLPGLGNIGAEAEVTWSGGPDLVLAYFSPPVIMSQGGNKVVIIDVTQNIGNVGSPSSVTRYFISNTEINDLSTATFIGERNVAPLGPDEESAQSILEFTLPSDLKPGSYFFAGCADGPEDIIELDEMNNCSFSEFTKQNAIVTGGMKAPNNPPDCGQATATPNKLWPPNHKLSSVEINGITDPDDDPVTIAITNIEQDEPVNGLGDGDKSPDGFGVGTSTAQVRSERSGLANGRIYIVGFIATDDNGASCDGSVPVGVVPHDQGKGNTAIDDGVRFDSTQKN